MKNTSIVSHFYSYEENSLSYSESIPQQTISIESDCTDLSINQHFMLFKSFLCAIGFSNDQVMSAAAELAFGESNSDEKIKELRKEFGFYTYSEVNSLENEVVSLKAKLERCQNPDYPQYLESEMEAMCLNY